MEGKFRKTFISSCFYCSTIIFFCFIVLSFNSVFAQNPKVFDNLRFYSLTTENGLPSNTITCLLQDSKGYLWIGTSAGLCRFDGYEMKVFSTESGNENSLTDNHITTLFEDSKKKLWIGTYNNGLCRYNPFTAEIEKIVLQEQAAADPLLANMGITSITENKEGDLWISSSSGIFKINPISLKIIVKPYTLSDTVSTIFGKQARDFSYLVYRNTYYSAQNNTVYASAECMIDNNGKADYAMMNEYFEKTGLLSDTNFVNRFKDFNGALDINCIAADAEGKLWMGSQCGGIFIFEIDKQTNKLKLVKYIFTNTIKSIFYDQLSGNFLAGSYGNGFFSINPATYHLKFVGNNPYDNHSLPQSTVSAVMRDNSGVLWIGTGGEGLYYSSPLMSSFFVFDKQNGNKNSPSSGNITSLFEDNDNTLWLGTKKNLNSFNLKTGEWKEWERKDTYKYGQVLNALSNIKSVAPKNESEIYVGTWGYGVFRFNKKSG